MAHTSRRYIVSQSKSNHQETIKWGNPHVSKSGHLKLILLCFLLYVYVVFTCGDTILSTR